MTTQITAYPSHELIDFMRMGRVPDKYQMSLPATTEREAVRCAVILLSEFADPRGLCWNGKRVYMDMSTSGSSTSAERTLRRFRLEAKLSGRVPLEYDPFSIKSRTEMTVNGTATDSMFDNPDIEVSC